MTLRDSKNGFSDQEFLLPKLGALSLLSFNKKAQNIQKTTESNLIITIIEWQNFFTTSYGYGNKVIDNVIPLINNTITSNIDPIYYEYVSCNQIALITSFKNMKRHEKIIDNFFNKCMGIGAAAKPTPIFINFKAGSARVMQSINSSINNAMTALSEAKKSLLYNQIIYSSNLQILKDEHHQMQLAAYLFEAFKSKRLRIAYQPVIKAKTGKVESYEALLRILTTDGKIISAGPFIPAAESCGFINLIDDFVLTAIVNELKSAPNVRIAMNISNVTVSDEKWYKKAKSLLTPDLSKRLIIEITETNGGNDVECIAAFANKIKLLGCDVAIDDFGVGYTSFKQLKLIKVDILKIDGIFVRDIIDNPKSIVFINTLLHLAKAYKLKTVAEFVESGEIAKILIDLGVDYLQGFYYDQALNYRPWIKGEKEKIAIK